MYIIAEIGINHDGDLNVAKELINGAAKAGADAVKFQYRNLSRAYHIESAELGDAMVKAEIERNFLSVSVVEKLAKYARELRLDVGISFFTETDFYDFKNHSFFDFYKLPSVEFTNTKLMSLLLDQQKQVYASLGCQSEYAIKSVLQKMEKYINLDLLHCVSNYPLAPHNCNLQYIKYFNDTYSRNIGYSSHESDWHFTLFAAAYGASIIERHISLGKREGLDETSSSDVKEFSEMVRCLRSYSDAKGIYGERFINQGELLNRQNLGRSFYLIRDKNKGDKIERSDLVYTSPATGLKIEEIDNYWDLPLSRDVKKGNVVCSSMFKEENKITLPERNFCRKKMIAIPVRIHDFLDIRDNFSVGHYEFHLSYTEIDQGVENVPIFEGDRYSIHLPDYISALDLIDPFDEGPVGIRSRFIIDQVAQFAKRIQAITGESCPVVGSFSVVSRSSAEFYDKIANLCQSLKEERVDLLPQWLPPIAWYFGGSIPLTVFNSTRDVNALVERDIPICFDSSHYLMCKHANLVDANDDLTKLLELSKHIHISGADGIDGEGTAFSEMDTFSSDLISKCLSIDSMKVIETWQGHLNNFSGFHVSIKDLFKNV